MPAMAVRPLFESSDDELALHIQGREILRLYDRPDTPFIAAQWHHALRDANVTEAFDAKRLIRNFNLVWITNILKNSVVHKMA